jgi:broad specificity phosphatase PhoE
MTIVSLVRHGLVYNPDEIYYGRLPGFRLDEAGHADVTAAGRYLADQAVAAIYHSPMQRARETAELLRTQLPVAVPLAESEYLHEVYSPFDGRSEAEMVARDWSLYEGSSPPHESPDEVMARVVAFFDYARARYPGQHVVGVSHGDPIRFAIVWGCGRMPAQRTTQDLIACGVPDGYPQRATVSTFTFADDADNPGSRPAFRYYNPAHTG